MRWTLWVVIPVILSYSCQPVERKPEGVLPHEEMVKLLSELYILEEKVVRLGLAPDSAQQVFELMRGNFFETAGVQDSVFKKSFDYYMDHPIEMEKIYTVLVDSMQLREQRTSFRPNE